MKAVQTREDNLYTREVGIAKKNRELTQKVIAFENRVTKENNDYRRRLIPIEEQKKNS